jgi:RNA polymerase sigma-70 factor, ECF subfamily
MDVELNRPTSMSGDSQSDDAHSDVTLLIQMARGDQQALQQLYARYRGPLWRYIWRLVNEDAQDAHLADEVTQDVFVAVWRQAATFRAEATPATWLFGIARHRALNARRDLARRVEGHLWNDNARDDEQDHWPFEEGEPSYEDAVIERMALADALDRLSAKHREALDLVFSYGFSLEETARVLDVPLGTIKSRLSYARRALQEHLSTAERLGDTR